MKTHQDFEQTSCLLSHNNKQYWKIASSLRYKKKMEKVQNHCLNKPIDVVYNQ
jgi:hypothetical protein